MAEAPQNYSLDSRQLEPVEISVPAECAGLRLDQALSRLLPEFSRARLTRWVRDHQVTVNGRVVLPRQKVWGGEQIRLIPAADPRAGAYAAQDIPLDVVHEDDALLVVDKPPGMVVHPGSGNWEGTLLNALLARTPALRQIPRAGIVHRLDKDTSGLLVVAKTLEAQAELVRQLQARKVTREYLAVVHGRVACGGKVEAPIGRHPVRRTRMAVVARGRHAVTHYAVIERYPNATLLRCRLETGRTHQIRVHLSTLGHPLLGDRTYGKRSPAPAFPRHALHATKLSLVHPRSQRVVTWISPLPPDMKRLINALRVQP